MENKIKQAVILAAGLGTRLRPVTDTIPKAMVPVLGMPLLEWHVRRFKECGVTEIFINLHYLPDVIKNHFGDGSKFGVSVRYFYEPEPLGTAGGVKNFEPDLDDEFFVVLADCISLVDYRKMEEEFRKLPKETIGLERVGKSDYLADADLVELDEAKKFIKLHPKPHSEQFENAYRLRGIFILKKKVLSYIPANEYADLNKEVMQRIVSAGEVFYGYECSEFSKGIDTVEKLQEVEKNLREKGIQTPS